MKQLQKHFFDTLYRQISNDLDNKKIDLKTRSNLERKLSLPIADQLFDHIIIACLEETEKIDR